MYHINIKIKICGEDLIFGPGLVELLTFIRNTGSMKEACAMMKMSYSKGWKIVNRAEQELGFALIERQHGGKRGGSCQITEEGESLLRRYTDMEKQIKQYAKEQFQLHYPEYCS